MRRGRYLWLFACAVLTGCEKELAWSLPNEPLGLQRYEQGRPIATCTVEPSSSVHKALASWIAEHQRGWSPSPVTYAPSTLVSGGKFSINFTGSLAVVNYPGGQYTLKVPTNEYAFLVCNAGT